MANPTGDELNPGLCGSLGHCGSKMVLAISLLDLNIGNLPLESKSPGRKYARGLADFAPLAGLPPLFEPILRGSAACRKLQDGAGGDLRRSAGDSR